MKYRKQQRGRMSGVATRGAEISFGEYGLKAMEPAWITGKQIEASRVAMTRFIKRGGKIWIRIFPDKPITKKPAETRMGKGKGAPEGWVAVVKPGRVLFEMEGVEREDRARGYKACGAEAADQDQIHHAQRSGRGRAGMKADDLRELSDDDLSGKLDELKESIFRMRFKLSLGNTDVVKQLREQRRDLARVKTLLRQREMAAAEK